MKHFKLLLGGLMSLTLVLSSCEADDAPATSVPENEISNFIYKVNYTGQQIANWEKTGSPFLENELDNSSVTFIDPFIPSKGGVFKPISTPQTRAFGVNPNQNRFWSMIRLKIGTINDPVRSYVIKAISDIEKQTNIRFYNSIEDPEIDPTYGFKYPNVHVQVAPKGQIGSSYIGLLGEEQYIYIPQDMANNPDKYSADEIVGFIKHALCNVAGMYNEQQRNDRDSYVTLYTANIQSDNLYHFNKITKNYFSRGSFDWSSITLAASYDFSKNGSKTITTKSGGTMPANTSLSDLDRMFLNYFYLPYRPRTDTYRELDDIVYDGDSRQLTESERIQLQAYLNNGNANPPSTGSMTPPAW